MSDMKRRVGFQGEAPVPISLAVRAGDFVLVSGLGDHFFRPEDVVFDAEGNVLDDGSGMGDAPIADQTRTTITRIESILREAGCSLDDVVDVIVWLKDPRDFVGFNEVYRSFFTRSQPARAVLRNEFMFKTKIEIKVTAYKPLPAATN